MHRSLSRIPGGRLAPALVLVLALAACGPKAKTPASPAKDTADGAAFLVKNAKEPGVTTLPDGLQYKVVKSGPAGGPSPKKGDEIKINYEGTLLSGEVFDSSFKRGVPAVMPLDHLVPGWMEALPMMHVGDEWIVYLPAKLGYGPEGQGPIPPNAVLVFRIQLLGVLPSGGGNGTANA
jgi:peptidylprolyl isomerase/FKBP-type peptidyl-prolyl cis-trans isomerase FklB